MSIDELIETGFCSDMAEALQMFPLETLDDFATEQPGPQPNDWDAF